MNIKLKDLLEVEKPLSELLQQNLPIKIAYHLGKLVKMVGSELKEFYDARDTLIKKYGKESEDTPGNWYIPEEEKDNIALFSQEIKDLVETEVSLEYFRPISINEFNNTNVQLTPVQMSALDVFFTE